MILRGYLNINLPERTRSSEVHHGIDADKNGSIHFGMQRIEGGDIGNLAVEGVKGTVNQKEKRRTQWIRLVPTDTLCVARSPQMIWWRLAVAAGWFTVALGILLALTDMLHFRFHSTSGIQGWVTVNQYPKQQEVFWFLAAVAGIPAAMLAGWVLWIVGAAIGARLTKQAPSSLLKTFAVWHLLLLVAWPRLCRLRPDAWEYLLPAAACGGLLCVLTVVHARSFSSRFHGASPTETAGARFRSPSSSEEDVINIQIVAAPPPPARWRVLLRIPWRVTTGLVVFVAVPVLLYLLLVDPVCDGAVDLFHEGEFLIPLDELLRGGIPYRDVYLQHGLFHNAWIPWLGAKVFEPTLTGVRAIHGYLDPLAYVSAYFLILVTCRTRLLAAAFLGFLFCGFCGSTVAIPGRALFGILSVTVLAAALTFSRGYGILTAPNPENDPCPHLRGLMGLCLWQGWPFPLAGALAMLAFWHSIEVGLYSLATGGLFLVVVGTCRAGISFWRRPLPLLGYGFGAAIAFIPIGVYFGIHGAIGDLLQNIWIQCTCQTDTWGKPFPNFFKVFHPILVGPNHPKWPDWLIKGKIQWYYGVVAFTVAAAFLAFRSTGAEFWRSRTAPWLLLITLAGINFFRTALGRSDILHIYYGVLFALVLAIFLADRLLATAWDHFTARGVCIRRRLLGLPWLVVGLIASASLVWFGNAAFKPLAGLENRWSRFHMWPPASVGKSEIVPRAGLAVIPDWQAGQIRKAVEYIREHTRPDEPVFDFSSSAGFLFFADRRIATRYFQVCYASLPGMQEEVVRDLERQRVPLVIFRSGSWGDDFDGVPAEKRHPLIAAYLFANYEPAITIGAVDFWRRKPETTGSTPLTTR
jgi:hypothetical protein